MIFTAKLGGHHFSFSFIYLSIKVNHVSLNFLPVRTYSNKGTSESRTDGPVTLLNKSEIVCAAKDSITSLSTLLLLSKAESRISIVPPLHK
jgi:hypothetical protein